MASELGNAEAVMANGSKYRRCQASQLTQLQAIVLASADVALANPSPRWPHGVIRSLIIRGLLDGKRRITDEGKAALLPRRRAA